MKKILFLSYTNVFSGAESVLCDYLKENNINENYIYTTNTNYIIQEYEKYLEKDKIYISEKMNIVSIRKHPFVAIKNLLYNLYKINIIVRKNNIDILYGNNTLDIALLVLYKKYLNRNIKVVSHIHDIIDKKDYKKFFIEKYNKYVDKFIVPSIATKESLKLCNINDEKIEVVYNGIELHEDKKRQYNFIREKFNINKDKKIICIIGQFCKRKRQDLFIDIVDCLNKKYNNKYVGIIIGQITDKDFYEEMKLKIQDPILFINDMKREEIFKYIYPNIDALILLSDRDPLPTVILEAMSMKTIVIARNVDGVKEIILDQINGFMIDYNFKIEILSTLIEQVMNLNEKDKIKIKNNARKTIQEKFTLEIKKNTINDIINNL